MLHKKSILYFKVDFSGQKIPQNFLEKIFGTNDFLNRSYEFDISLSYCPVCGKQLSKYVDNEEDSCKFCSNSTGENLISRDDDIYIIEDSFDSIFYMDVRFMKDFSEKKAMLHYTLVDKYTIIHAEGNIEMRYCPKCGKDLMISLLLEEKPEEKKTGCEYCSSSESCFGDGFLYGRTLIYSTPENEFGENFYGENRINYCPMCGEKLYSFDFNKTDYISEGEGCNYCNGEDCIIGNWANGISLDDGEVTSSYYDETFGGSGHSTDEVNYCPMCGRKF